MCRQKPPVKQAAFSLLELIVVIVLIGILAAVAIPKFGSKQSFESRAAAAELVSHLRFAQQLSMNHTSNSITVSVTATEIDIQSNSVSLNDYPHDFSNDYSTTFSNANFSYSSLGETTATTVNVTPSSGVNVCVENSGYAWLC